MAHRYGQAGASSHGFEVSSTWNRQGMLSDSSESCDLTSLLDSGNLSMQAVVGE